MIPIIYEANETAFISNGLGRLRDIISAKVVEERNGIYECDFEYPVDGAHFEQIQCGCVIATTHDESGNVDLFDIVSHSKPINGIVTFHAVHVSYRLGGVVCRAQNINSLDAALQAMVETAVPSDTMVRFTLGADFQSSGYMAAFDYIPRSARQLMGGIEGSILDTYGGEWEFSGFNVTLKRARGSLRDFTIRYGLNLLDYKDDTDYSGTFVSCVPFWVGVDGTGGETVVSGNKVDSGASSYTGRDICVPLDLTEKFQDAPTAAQLESMAATYMTANQTNMPAQNITVDFVRLQEMGEFEEFENLLQCNLCDSIKVVFPLYGMSGTFKIVKTTYDVLKERYESMELGALSTTLAEALGISETAKSINTIEDFAISGDLAVGGDASVVGSIVAGGTIDAVNILKNGKNYIGYQTFNFTVTFSAGTIGSRGYQGSEDASLEGYTPIGVSVVSVGASGSYIPVAFLSGTTVYFNAYRATTSAVNGSLVTARVIYRKD